MPPFPSRQLVRRLAVPALASAVAAGVAGAQPFTERYVAAGVQSATPPAGAACGTPIFASGPGITSAACTFAGGEFSVLGRAVDGRVGAYARVTAAPPGAPTSNIFDAQARAQWGDRFTFTGVVPAKVRMDVRWDGTLSGHASGDAGANVSAAWNFQASSTNGIQVAEYHDNRSLVAAGNPISGNPADVFETVVDEQSFLMPIIPTGSTAFPYLDFSLILFAHGTVVGGFGPGGGTAISNFNDTGLIAGLAFFDAAGADITSSVSYLSTRGTLIGPVATAVPEPATVTLVAGGVLALAGAARRRRA